MDIGPQSESDGVFQAVCRLRQSRYRAEVLGEDYGYGPQQGSRRKYGNMLVNGEKSGSNFISDAAFEFAKEKVEEKKVNKFLTIDGYRLFNNMLSSMPMCFNLFADLRVLLTNDPLEATRVAQLLFAEIGWIDELVEVDVEFIPIPIEDYINDKSAFDAMLVVKDKHEGKGLISIETKYTDLLGVKTATDSERKNELVEEGGFFNERLKKELKEKGYKQIHRNFLLTYVYAIKNYFGHFVHVIISPGADRLSMQEIEELQKNMLNYQDRILKIDLEAFVERGYRSGNEAFSEVMKKFSKRYLD